MKFATLAALALVGRATAMRFDTAEGPTKVDFGENDDGVVSRADDDGTAAWQKPNPLSWTDGGDDDHVVLTMVDGSLRSTAKAKHHHRKHHMHVVSALTMVDGSMRP